ncbi:hypothetical protein VPHK567_0209 [Vibrio phage K567]|nr:hypothetical protein MYOV011v1_p0005 [Vibrio phage 6E35.1a]
MPYAIILTNTNGETCEIKPLVNNSLKSEYGLECRKIQQNAALLAKRIEKFDDVESCVVKHY